MTAFLKVGKQTMQKKTMNIDKCRVSLKELFRLLISASEAIYLLISASEAIYFVSFSNEILHSMIVLMSACILVRPLQPNCPLFNLIKVVIVRQTVPSKSIYLKAFLHA
jgi:hypothetical protein